MHRAYGVILRKRTDKSGADTTGGTDDSDIRIWTY